MAQLQIRLPDDLMARIDFAAEKTGLSKNDIIKLTIDAGLKWLAASNYDLTSSADPAPVVQSLMKELTSFMAKLMEERGLPDAGETLHSLSRRIQPPAAPSFQSSLNDEPAAYKTPRKPSGKRPA